MPVFHSVFADIGDEQSIAESLSTFSAHIANVVAMDKALALPALVLLDEAGGGTDPNEGGALATAIIDHFRRARRDGRRDDALRRAEDVRVDDRRRDVGGFGFNPETFAPTYRLHYGSPGSSLALEIATRLGLPRRHHRAGAGAADERARRSSPSTWRRSSATCRRSITSAGWSRASAQMVEETQRKLHGARAGAARSRRDVPQAARSEARRAAARRAAGDRHGRRRAEARASSIAADADRRAARLVPTGDIGSARADARSALEGVEARLRGGDPAGPPSLAGAARPAGLGDRVAVGPLGLEGIVQSMHDGHAEVDVRGKRMRRGSTSCAS